MHRGLPTIFFNEPITARHSDTIATPVQAADKIALRTYCFTLRCAAMDATSYTIQSVVHSMSRDFALPASLCPTWRACDALQAMNWLRWLVVSFAVYHKLKQSIASILITLHIVWLTLKWRYSHRQYERECANSDQAVRATQSSGRQGKRQHK